MSYYYANTANKLNNLNVLHAFQNNNTRIVNKQIDNDDKEIENYLQNDGYDVKNINYYYDYSPIHRTNNNNIYVTSGMENINKKTDNNITLLKNTFNDISSTWATGYNTESESIENGTDYNDDDDDDDDNDDISTVLDEFIEDFQDIDVHSVNVYSTMYQNT
jgi:hypothetical protein